MRRAMRSSNLRGSDPQQAVTWRCRRVQANRTRRRLLVEVAEAVGVRAVVLTVRFVASVLVLVTPVLQEAEHPGPKGFDGGGEPLEFRHVRVRAPAVQAVRPVGDVVPLAAAAGVAKERPQLFLGDPRGQDLPDVSRTREGRCRLVLREHVHNLARVARLHLTDAHSGQPEQDRRTVSLVTPSAVGS
jgi:hypothetical protein